MLPQTPAAGREEPKLTAPSEAMRSTTSKYTFSTVAFSDVIETQTMTSPRTIYAESTIGNRTSTRVPGVLRAAYKFPIFKCPYCSLTLESGLMMNRKHWK